MSSYSYTLLSGLSSTSAVMRSDGKLIPNDPRNLDWLAYLTWQAKGGKPSAAVTEPTPVPPSITAAQARIALSRAGLLDKAQAAVNAAGGDSLIYWEYAPYWDRSNATVTALATAIGLTSAQIDSLFIQAGAL